MGLEMVVSFKPNWYDNNVRDSITDNKRAFNSQYSH